MEAATTAALEWSVSAERTANRHCGPALRSMPTRRTPTRVVAAGLAAPPGSGGEAVVPLLDERPEGSDFVAYAARSRDDGVSRASSLDCLGAYPIAIRGFSAELRW